MASLKDGDDPKSSDYTSTTGAVDTGGEIAAMERGLAADIEGGSKREDNEHGDREKRGVATGAGGSKNTKWSDKWDIKEHNT